MNSFLRSSSAICTHSKTLCLGWEVAMFGEATKREWQGVTLTGKQHISTTVGKSWSGLPHLLLLSLIRTIFSHYCQWRSSGLSSLATAGDDQVPKAPEVVRALTTLKTWMLLMKISILRFHWKAHATHGNVVTCWEQVSKFSWLSLMTFTTFLCRLLSHGPCNVTHANETDQNIENWAVFV